MKPENIKSKNHWNTKKFTQSQQIRGQIPQETLEQGKKYVQS